MSLGSSDVLVLFLVLKVAASKLAHLIYLVFTEKSKRQKSKKKIKKNPRTAYESG